MESFKDAFEMVQELCRSELSEVAYNLWIKDITPVRLENSTAVLHIHSKFKKTIVEEKYADLLLRAFEEVLGFPVQVNLLYDEPGDPGEPTPEPIPEGGEYEYTFSTFIVGPANKFAHAASLAVATNPARSYNPLFIYGGSGLGKTHLLYAIWDEIKRNQPDSNIIYVRGEEFTNALINAITNESTIAFHENFRKADVLLVDDIQFIGGKERTQEEFFHTFNSIYQAGKQIVLTSDRPPKEIKTLEDRLRTRFEWGLLADVQPPDFETRIAIIRRKAQLLELTVPPEVAEYIANRIKNNIRQLEGAVKKLKAYEQLASSPPSIIMAQNAIRDILTDNQPIPVTVDRIITEVSRTYGVAPAEIRSSKRSAQISSARQLCMHIVREITQMSMATIGEEFGGRDHSTVVYALQQVDRQLQSDPIFKETVEDIIKNIRER